MHTKLSLITFFHIEAEPSCGHNKIHLCLNLSVLQMKCCMFDEPCYSNPLPLADKTDRCWRSLVVTAIVFFVIGVILWSTVAGVVSNPPNGSKLNSCQSSYILAHPPCFFMCLISLTYPEVLRLYSCGVHM